MRRIIGVLLLTPIALGAQTAADHYQAGRVAYDLKPDDAVKSFERAVALDGKNAEYHLWLGRALGTVAQRASPLRQPFLARRVKSAFERTVQLDPANLGGREGLMQFYLQAPGIMGGSAGKAREQAEEIAKLNPLRGRFARATIAGREKDQAAGERELRAAAAENPDSAVAHSQLAAYLANAGRAGDAFAVLDAYVARRPGDPAGLFAVGRAAAVTGQQLERGEQALRQLLAMPPLPTDQGLPSPANMHHRLGDILAKKGAKEEARTEYEAALKLNPRLEAAKRALKAL